MTTPDGQGKSRNQALAEQFAQLGRRIAEAPDMLSLLETAIFGLQEDFVVPFVWVSLLDRPENTLVIQAVRKGGRLADRLNVPAEEDLLPLLTRGAKPVLANEDLRVFFRLFPRRKKYFLRSIAVLPLCRDGRILGSLNLGDADPERYAPTLNTVFLEQLAERIAVRLHQFAV